MAPAWEGKTYKLVDQENFDEFLKACGVGMIFRKMGAAWKPDVQLIKDGDEYILKSTSSVKNTEVRFKPGVEFDEVTADNRKVKSTFTFENENKLVQIQKGDTTSEFIREFTETGATTIMKCGSVTAVRRYEC